MVAKIVYWAPFPLQVMRQEDNQPGVQPEKENKTGHSHLHLKSWFLSKALLTRGSPPPIGVKR
eukprot:scaffold313279_cov16-Prasinocladus_malaysianus.AAC.1